MLIYLLLLLLLSWAPLREPQSVQSDKSAKLAAMEAGKSAAFPASRRYKAVLRNEGKNPIFLNAVQMPGGYSGDGRFFGCSLQIRDKKNRRWITYRLYEFYNAHATPHIVQVQVAFGETLEVCGGLYPEQEGHAGDCARFALSAERGQEPLFFSNIFRIVGSTKGEHSEECKP